MEKSIKKNYVYNVLYQVLLVITPLLTAPYLARVLGAERIGIYSYYYSIAYYFSMFAMLGVNNYGNRSCAAVRDSEYALSKTFSEIYTLQVFMSILSALVYYTLTIFCFNANRTIALIMGLYVIAAGVDVNWFFFGIEEFKLTTLRNVIVRLLTTACIFLFVKSENDLPMYVFLMGGSTLVSQLIMWPYLKRHIHFIIPKPRDVFKHIKPNVILFIPVIAVSLYKIMDKIMLGSMSTMIETGYYENTEKLINIPLGFINALGIVMLPRMSNLVANMGTRKIKQLIDMSFLFVSFLSVAMTFGIMGIANEFVPLFFGEEFIPAVKLVKWIAPTMIFFSFANVIRTQYLLPNKKDNFYIFSVLSGAAINLIINFLLIPRFHAFGAVIGTLAAEGSVCILQLAMVKNELPVGKYVLRGLVFIPIGILMYLAVRSVSFLPLNIWITVILEIIVGIFVYVPLSYIYIRVCCPEILMPLNRNRHVK